jgi:hypothetical protein
MGGKAMNKASMHNDVLCLEFTSDSIEKSDNNCHIFYPSGKPIMHHLLRFQGFAVYDRPLCFESMGIIGF